MVCGIDTPTLIFKAAYLPVEGKYDLVTAKDLFRYAFFWQKYL
jgi:hypothetical protein